MRQVRSLGAVTLLILTLPSTGAHKEKRGLKRGDCRQARQAFGRPVPADRRIGVTSSSRYLRRAWRRRREGKLTTPCLDSNSLGIRV
jgi:hypothetical protein